jgi:hypothetical protein
VLAGRLAVDTHPARHRTAGAAEAGRIHKLAEAGGTSTTLADFHSLCGL